MEVQNDKLWLLCSASWFQEEGVGVGEHQPAEEGGEECGGGGQ